MLIALSLAAVLSGQTPPAPPRVETRRETRVVTVGGTGGMDRDGDGFVAREEFSAPMNDAFDRLDKDGDGRLSSEEMAANDLAADRGSSAYIPGSDGPGAGVRTFRLRGPVGGDGDVLVLRGGSDGWEVDTVEGERRLAVIRGGPGGEGGMDKDGDGRVTEEEFVAPLRDAFRRLDKDGSGVIEDGERTRGDGVTIVTRRSGDR